jgi:Acetyltransferase (GNAT) domain
MTLAIVRYTAQDGPEWDHFVARSKNGTFLFQRSYMDYHRDRLVDHSLLVRASRNRLVALLPANEDSGELVSHGGLTYGGFLVSDEMRATTMLEVLAAVRSYLPTQGLQALRYKTIPHIYHRSPSEDDLYALFRAGATLYRRDLSTAVRPPGTLPRSTQRRRALAKAQAAGLHVQESEDFAAFWEVLGENLRAAHGVKPVHTVAEITQLASRFTDNIRLHVGLREDTVLAGVLVYDTGIVAHAQYIAASEEGKRLNVLDLVFDELIERSYRDRRFFDFGISTESQGTRLNSGLVAFKEGFGGRAVVHDFYLLPSD